MTITIIILVGGVVLALTNEGKPLSYSIGHRECQVNGYLLKCKSDVTTEIAVSVVSAKSDSVKSVCSSDMCDSINISANKVTIYKHPQTFLLIPSQSKVHPFTC